MRVGNAGVVENGEPQGHQRNRSRCECARPRLRRVRSFDSVLLRMLNRVEPSDRVGRGRPRSHYSSRSRWSATRNVASPAIADRTDNAIRGRTLGLESPIFCDVT